MESLRVRCFICRNRIEFDKHMFKVCVLESEASNEKKILFNALYLLLHVEQPSIISSESANFRYLTNF